MAEPEPEKEEVPDVHDGFKVVETPDQEVELALVPAEPRPPEPRIDAVELASAETEPESDDVRVESVSEPEIEKEDTVVTVVETAEVVETVETVDTVEVAEVDKTDVTAEESADIPITTALSTEYYYLQLAAFTEELTAVNLYKSLSAVYPVTVFKSADVERPVFRILLGPLSQDESGVLLYTFRAKGYKDAFVRRGK